MTNAERFRRLFRGRENAYGQYYVNPKGPNDIKTVSGAIPDEAIERHLKGEKHGLGSVPIMLSNECYFGAIDLDDPETEHLGLASQVYDLGLPLVVCKSKSGGAHLYLFLNEPAPAKLVSEKLTLWAGLLGIGNPLDRPIEIFPKQTKLAKDKVGNWINLPYYGGKKHDRVAIGPALSYLTLGNFLAFAESQATTAAELKVWTLEAKGERFQDGPPCLATLDTIGYDEGGRNNGLYNICVLFKMSNPDGWKEEVEAYHAEKMSPPLTAREVSTIIDSVERRDYGYRGQDPPMSAYCCQGTQSHLKALCGGRKFGYAAGARASAAGALPPLSNLRKLETRPPVYYLDVGDKEVRLTPDELANFRKFRLVVMAECDTLLPLMKENTWIQFVEPLLQEAEKIKAPEEASEMGVLKAHLDEFLDRRHQANSREDLLRDMPVEEEGVCLFRATDLMALLDRRRFRISSSDLWASLRELGAAKLSISVKGKTVRVWKIPTPDSQTEEFASRTNAGPDF